MKRALCTALLLPLLAACVPASRIVPVDSLAQLSTDEVVLVGRIELNPPLKPGEQRVGERYPEFQDVAVMVTDRELRPVGPMLRWGDLGGRLDAPLGQDFYMRHPAVPFYILKGFILMHTDIGPNASPGTGQAPLQGVFRVELRPGDRAVYIGTLRYTRDEFFETRASVRDDYVRAQKAFKARFGSNLSLRKSLAQPVERR